MKRKLVLLAIALVSGLVIYLFSNRYYLKNIYNYNRVIKTHLEAYYVNSDPLELKEISKLFQVYSFDDSIRSKIQQKSKEVVQSWYDYVNSKYVCDQFNKNTCIIYLSELYNVNEKIRQVYIYTPYEGYNIVEAGDYNRIQTDYDKRKIDIEAIINNKDAKRPMNYEDIRKEKCKKAKECDECKKGLCNCTYVNPNNVKETVFCKETEKSTSF